MPSPIALSRCILPIFRCEFWKWPMDFKLSPKSTTTALQTTPAPPLPGLSAEPPGPPPSAPCTASSASCGASPAFFPGRIPTTEVTHGPAQSHCSQDSSRRQYPEREPPNHTRVCSCPTSQLQPDAGPR